MNDRSINRTEEVAGAGTNGGLWLLVLLLLVAGAVASPVFFGKIGIIGLIACVILAVLTLSGFYAIQPNQA